MPRKLKQQSTEQAAPTKGKTARRSSKPRPEAAKRPNKAKSETVKQPRKPRESYCYSSCRDEGENWSLHSVSNSRTYEDAMFTQGWPELFGQPNVVWFTPPMTEEYDKSAANLAAGLWGGCINRMMRALLEQIKQGLALKDGLVVTITGAKIRLAAVEWNDLHLLEMVPIAPMVRAPWGLKQSDQTDGSTMSGKGRQQTPRKPATKFAHLRKKMEKNRIAAKISKKKGDRRP